MADETSFFRGAIETLTYTIIPAEPVKAGQLVNFKGKVAQAGDKVHGVATHDAEAQDLAAGLRIAVIGQIDLAAGSKITAGDTVGAGADGALVSGVDAAPACGTALRDAQAGERVAILLFPH